MVGIHKRNYELLMIIILAGMSYPIKDHVILGEHSEVNAPFLKEWL
jgi:hypothetical protein